MKLEIIFYGGIFQLRDSLKSFEAGPRTQSDSARSRADEQISRLQDLYDIYTLQRQERNALSLIVLHTWINQLLKFPDLWHYRETWAMAFPSFPVAQCPPQSLMQWLTVLCFVLTGPQSFRSPVLRLIFMMSPLMVPQKMNWSSSDTCTATLMMQHEQHHHICYQFGQLKRQDDEFTVLSP